MSGLLYITVTAGHSNNLTVVDQLLWSYMWAVYRFVNKSSKLERNMLT